MNLPYLCRTVNSTPIWTDMVLSWHSGGGGGWEDDYIVWIAIQSA